MTAERTVEAFQEEIAQARRLVRDSETKRHEGLAPLRWVESLTDSSLSYDPNFPIDGSFQLRRTSVQMVGTHVNGSTLQLTSQVTIGGVGQFTSIGANIPIIK